MLYPQSWCSTPHTSVLHPGLWYTIQCGNNNKKGLVHRPPLIHTHARPHQYACPCACQELNKVRHDTITCAMMRDAIPDHKSAGAFNRTTRLVMQLMIVSRAVALAPAMLRPTRVYSQEHMNTITIRRVACAEIGYMIDARMYLFCQHHHMNTSFRENDTHV
jgi:hypothetical protein